MDASRVARWRQKKFWLGLALLSWTVFSVSFVCDRVYMDIKAAAAEQANEAVVLRLLAEAKNESCTPFPVSYLQEQVFLINTACLQQRTASHE